MNRHRSEGKEVGRGQNEVDFLEIERSRHEIITVNVTVKAVFDAVFVEHVDNLAADKIVVNGGKVKENEELLFALAPVGRIGLQALAFLKTQLKAHSLAVYDLIIVWQGVSHRALFCLVVEPAAASADNEIFGLKSVVVEHVDGGYLVFFEKVFHFGHC